MADWTDSLHVFCADIGSIARNSFAWARRIEDDGVEVHAPEDIGALADEVARLLAADRPVALGFEAPMFVPVPEDPVRLGKARPCDKGAPAWAGNVGASVLATALVQVPWVLRRINERVPGVEVHVGWKGFAGSRRGLLLWEAFVSGAAKGATHEEDAQAGIEAFCAQLPSVGDAVAHDTERPFSVVAAAALWAGFEVSKEDLRSPCVLVRA